MTGGIRKLKNMNGLPGDLTLPNAADEGRQLALDLGQDLSFPPAATSLQVFEHEVRGKELLIELARALGEQRAAVDIKLFRETLVDERAS
jgi:hypothetical protein